MKWLCAVMVAVISLAPAARAQDDVNPDELRRKVDAAMDQLKAAQERKNQLAAENDQLKAKVAETQKQLDAAQSQLAELQRQAAGYAEKTFYFRSHYVAWQEFLRRYPSLMAKWKVFLNNDHLTSPRDLPDFSDPNWPADAESQPAPASHPAPVSQPTTASVPDPASQPATAPAAVPASQSVSASPPAQK